MSNQRLEEAQSRTERLANALCISTHELDGVSHEIIGDSGEDGVLSGYVIQFSRNAPVQILNKIKGLSTENTVYVSASLIDGDHDGQRPRSSIAGPEGTTASMRKTSAGTVKSKEKPVGE
jgi:hypothetical protein